MGIMSMNISEKRKALLWLGCLAHARRMFEHALSNDKDRAEKALLWIQEVYAAEREARAQACTPEQRYHLRQQKTKPVMEEMEK